MKKIQKHNTRTQHDGDGDTEKLPTEHTAALVTTTVNVSPNMVRESWGYW